MVNNVKSLPFDHGIGKKIEELVNRLLSSDISLESIILFGSYARAEYKLTSDIDVLAITKTEVPREVRGGLCAEFDERGADLVFYTADTFQKSDCLFTRLVRRDGILLWKC